MWSQRLAQHFAASSRDDARIVMPTPTHPIATSRAGAAAACRSGDDGRALAACACHLVRDAKHAQLVAHAFPRGGTESTCVQCSRPLSAVCVACAAKPFDVAVRITPDARVSLRVSADMTLGNLHRLLQQHPTCRARWPALAAANEVYHLRVTVPGRPADTQLPVLDAANASRALGALGVVPGVALLVRLASEPQEPDEVGPSSSSSSAEAITSTFGQDCTLLRGADGHVLHMHCAEGWLSDHQSCPCSSHPWAQPLGASVAEVTVRVVCPSHPNLDVRLPLASTFDQAIGQIRTVAETAFGPLPQTLYLRTGLIGDGGTWCSSSSKTLRDFVVGGEDEPFQAIFGVCGLIAHSLEWALTVRHRSSATDPASEDSASASPAASPKPRSEYKVRTLPVQSTWTVPKLHADIEVAFGISKDRQRLELVNSESSTISLPHTSSQKLVQLGFHANSTVECTELTQFGHRTIDTFTKDGLWLDTFRIDAARDDRIIDFLEETLKTGGIRQNVRLLRDAACAFEGLDADIDASRASTEEASEVDGHAPSAARARVADGAGAARWTTLQEVLSCSVSWYPSDSSELQTDAGMANFLASMYMATSYLAARLPTALRVLGYFRSLGASEPAVYALYLMTHSKLRHMVPAYQAVLANAVYRAIRQLIGPDLRSLTPESRTFEHSRTFFSGLIRECAGRHAATEIYSTTSVAVAALGVHPSATPQSAYNVRLELLRAMMPDATHAFVYVGTPNEPMRVGDVEWPSWKDWLRNTDDLPAFRVSTPPTIAVAPTPSLTRDQRGHLAVSVSREKSSDNRATLFCPLLSGEVDLTVSELESALKALGQSAFLEYQFVDTREPEGAILVVIDCSQSMGGRAGFLSESGEPEADFEEDDSGRHHPLPGTVPPDSYHAELWPWSQINEFRRAERWFMSHPSFGEWKFVRAIQLDFLAELLRFLIDFVPSSRAHIPSLAKYADVFDAMLMGRTIAPYQAIQKREAELMSHASVAASSPAAAASCADVDGDVAMSLAPASDTVSDSPTSPSSAGVPESFLCPICYNQMNHPVVALDGFTYCKKCIATWLRDHSRSPMTGVMLHSKQLTPNNSMRSQIAEFVQKQATHARCETDRLRRLVDAYKAAPTPADAITVNATWPNGRSIEIPNISPTMQTSALAELIGALANDPRDLSSLLEYHGRQIARGRCIGEYSVAGSAVLRVREPASALTSAYHARGATPRTGRVQVTIRLYHRPDAQPITLLVFPDETIAQLKFKLRRANPALGLNQYHLWFNMTNAGDGACSGNLTFDESRVASYLHISAQVTPKTLITAEDVASSPNTVWLFLVEQPMSPVPLRGTRQSKPTKRSFLSRLETVKQLFSAFINRSVAYDYPQAIGALTFSDKDRIKVICPIQARYESFRAALDAVQAGGDTALFDALEVACESLVTWKVRSLRAAISVHRSRSRFSLVSMSCCSAIGRETRQRETANPLPVGRLRFGFIGQAAPSRGDHAEGRHHTGCDSSRRRPAGRAAGRLGSLVIARIRVPSTQARRCSSAVRTRDAARTERTPSGEPVAATEALSGVGVSSFRSACQSRAVGPVQRRQLSTSKVDVRHQRASAFVGDRCRSAVRRQFRSRAPRCVRGIACRAGFGIQQRIEAEIGHETHLPRASRVARQSASLDRHLPVRR